MQALPRLSSGTLASTSAGMTTLIHQQSALPPEHSFGLPQRGQMFAVSAFASILVIWEVENEKVCRCSTFDLGNKRQCFC
jgi:hypothetical protein